MNNPRPLVCTLILKPGAVYRGRPDGTWQRLEDLPVNFRAPLPVGVAPAAGFVRGKQRDTRERPGPIPHRPAADPNDPPTDPSATRLELDLFRA